MSSGGRRVRYYDPKAGDFVAGVVVRSDGRTLDVDIGAGGEPALMLAKEAVPVSGEEFGYLACQVASESAGGVRRGRAGGRCCPARRGRKWRRGAIGWEECEGERSPGGGRRHDRVR
jgi:hypothetical protein